MLAPDYRISALRHRISSFTADILCLQEVEADTFEALENTLRPSGYTGCFAQKAQGKPDGCAVFFQAGSWAPLDIRRLAYQDETENQSRSGHIAQLLTLQQAHRILGIANTHLKWDPPGTSREQQYGYRQARQVLDACEAMAPAETAWIVCGDLNATPESDVVATLHSAGFNSAHAASVNAYTSNANAKAKTIDYLSYNAPLRAQPDPLPPIEDHTPLPGPGQPSDHLAVGARFEWVDAMAHNL